MTEVDKSDELFRLTDANGDLDDATVFLLDIVGTGSQNFGIYDPVTGERLEVFSHLDTPITSATLSWDIFSDLVTNVGTGETAVIDWESFGFYDDQWLSEAGANPGSIDHLYSFEVGALAHPSLLGSNLALIWFDSEQAASRGTGHYDFIAVSDIEPIGNVPEPGLPLLLSGGLVGLGYTRRLSA